MNVGFEYGTGDVFVKISSKSIVIPAADSERAELFGIDPFPGQIKQVRLQVGNEHKCVIEVGRRIPLTCLQSVPDLSNVLYHFYHCWVSGDIELCVKILNEHIDALICSGLLEQIKGRFFIGFVGSEKNIISAQNVFKQRNIEFKMAAFASEGFEQVTQTSILKHVIEPNAYILYTHNKGSMHAGPKQDWWRRAMTFYNVYDWRETIILLHKTKADVAGIHWLTKENHPSQPIDTPFFGGTFWWSTITHLRRLGPPKTTSRYDAELWIGQCTDIKAIDRKPHAGWPHYDEPDTNT